MIFAGTGLCERCGKEVRLFSCGTLKQLVMTQEHDCSHGKPCGWFGQTEELTSDTWCSINRAKSRKNV